MVIIKPAEYKVIDTATVVENQQHLPLNERNKLYTALNDAIKECKMMGVTITEEMKRIYCMMNVNEKIFEQTLVLWHGILTRKLFPDNHDALKAYVMLE